MHLQFIFRRLHNRLRSYKNLHGDLKTERKFAVAIMGPTGSGKTETSFLVAKELNGEIISADSRQVYKNMPVATAQPDNRIISEIRHYFISELEPEQEFSAGEFASKARNIVRDCFRRSVQPVITGGSGLYMRALTDGFYEREISSPEVRSELNRMLEEKGKYHMHQMLKQVDPASAESIAPEFSRRVFRALEVYMITGNRLSEMNQINSEPDFETLKFAVDLPREMLYERINKRVILMLESGLINEVTALMNHYHYSTTNSVNTVGIKEVMMYLEGRHDEKEMIRLIQRNTRRYAKRQMTWLRKERGLTILSAPSGGRPESSELSEWVAGEVIKRTRKYM